MLIEMFYLSQKLDLWFWQGPLIIQNTKVTVKGFHYFFQVDALSFGNKALTHALQIITT